MNAGFPSFVAPAPAVQERIRWWPMIFSVFGLLLPNGLYLRGDATPLEWVLAAFGSVAFVVLSALAVVAWQRHRTFLWIVVLLMLLGVVYIPMTFAATVFFALAAHMLPWATGGDVARSASYGAAIVVLVLCGYWLMPEHGVRWVNLSLYFALTIVGQMWTVRLCLNLRRLAEGAERQRIADDLNDLLGEALSKITLKAQVAGRLLESGARPERVLPEIAAAEKVCRDALADVRQTIRAYRAESRAEQGQFHVGN